jgi:hypothetical protein
MTAKESTESETYTVDAVAKNGDAPVTLEDFLIGKLGNSTGKKLYKELVSAVKDSTKAYNGSPAIALDTRRGPFVVFKQAN